MFGNALLEVKETVDNASMAAKCLPSYLLLAFVLSTQVFNVSTQLLLLKTLSGSLTINPNVDFEI